MSHFAMRHTHVIMRHHASSRKLGSQLLCCLGFLCEVLTSFICHVVVPYLVGGLQRQQRSDVIACKVAFRQLCVCCCPPKERLDMLGIHSQSLHM